MQVSKLNIETIFTITNVKFNLISILFHIVLESLTLGKISALEKVVVFFGHSAIREEKYIKINK